MASWQKNDGDGVRLPYGKESPVDPDKQPVDAITQQPIASSGSQGSAFLHNASVSSFEQNESQIQHEYQKKWKYLSNHTDRASTKNNFRRITSMYYGFEYYSKEFSRLAQCLKRNPEEFQSEIQSSEIKVSPDIENDDYFCEKGEQQEGFVDLLKTTDFVNYHNVIPQWIVQCAGVKFKCNQALLALQQLVKDESVNQSTPQSYQQPETGYNPDQKEHEDMETETLGGTDASSIDLTFNNNLMAGKVNTDQAMQLPTVDTEIQGQYSSSQLQVGENPWQLANRDEEIQTLKKTIQDMEMKFKTCEEKWQKELSETKSLNEETKTAWHKAEDKLKILEDSHLQTVEMNGELQQPPNSIDDLYLRPKKEAGDIWENWGLKNQLDKTGNQHKYDEEIKKLRKELADHIQLKKDLSEKQFKSMKRAADAETELANLTHSFNDFKKEYNKLTKSKDQLSKQNQGHVRTIEEMKQNNETVNKQFKAKITDLLQQLNTIQTAKTELEREKNRVVAEHGRMYETYLGLLKENDGHTQCINQLTQHIRQMQHENQQKSDAHVAKITEFKEKLGAAEIEKEKLLTRLSKIAGAKLTQGNAGITDLSDQNRPMKVAEKYSELYDNEWTDALEELLEYGGGISDDQGIAILLEIVVEAYRFCCKTAEEYSQGILLSVTCLPACQKMSDLQQVQLTDEHKQMLEEIRKTLSPQLIQSVEQKYLLCLRETLLKHFGKQKVAQVRPNVRPIENVDAADTDVQQAAEAMSSTDEQLHREQDDTKPLNEENNQNETEDDAMDEDTGKTPTSGTYGNDMDNIIDNVTQEETHVRQQQEMMNDEQLKGDGITEDSNKSIGETAGFVTDEELRRREEEYVRNLPKTDNEESTFQNVGSQDVEMKEFTSEESEVDESTQPTEESGCKPKEARDTAEQNEELGTQCDSNQNQDQDFGGFVHINNPDQTGKDKDGLTDEKRHMKRNTEKREEYIMLEIQRSGKVKNENQDVGNITEEKMKHEPELDTENSIAKAEMITNENLSGKRPGEAGGDRFSDFQGQDSTDTSHTQPELEEVIELDSSFEKINDFGKKCANLCWMMRVREPPLHMEYDVQLGSELNTDFFKHYTQSGKIVKYLVWPALFLHKNGALLAKGVVQPMKKKEERIYKSEQQQKS